jgi:hypothetical protein
VQSRAALSMKLKMPHMHARSRTQHPSVKFDRGVEEALGKMRPTIAACKSEFRILKRVLIERVTFRGHVVDETRTFVPFVS